MNRTKAGISCIAGLGVLGIALLCCLRFREVSDAALMDRFVSKRQDFDLLQQMILADTSVMHIRLGVVEYKPYSAPQLPAERVAKYRELMDRLRLRSISGTHREVGAVSLGVQSFLTGGGKGYVFTPKPPFPVAESLDNYSPPSPGSFSAYRQLGDNWYIYKSKGF